MKYLNKKMNILMCLLPLIITTQSFASSNSLSFSNNKNIVAWNDDLKQLDNVAKALLNNDEKQLTKDSKNKNLLVKFDKKQIKKVENKSDIIKAPMKGETCWDGAAKFHNVDPWLLYSIAYVESGFNPLAIGKNKNGTTDIGMMQINDKVWLGKLKKMGINKKMLKDPCVSVYVGAWILRQNIDQFGYTAKAIGAYNSRTPRHNITYAKKIYAAYEKFAKLHQIKIKKEMEEQQLREKNKKNIDNKNDDKNNFNVVMIKNEQNYKIGSNLKLDYDLENMKIN